MRAKRNERSEKEGCMQAGIYIFIVNAAGSKSRGPYRSSPVYAVLPDTAPLYIHITYIYNIQTSLHKLDVNYNYIS